mmetsp:Transcript_835/g.1873  ORF Transcript_835/g.1873 Transcript_835/m.1873 type:complete len:190 (+) Transcript_835:135-704(+)|eukprot:CAMPEP_0206481496 /NCGR_PEP_ID=MMETSP0324_2-20121206/38191_1 /ASSEMBLY_ACC=CAM_ASM_000836 /TAXON_ID=2866 /ORGANISM="Crypthecodinium cohnii, Strain Seligo" /LENGTH=189 /DNA_ID=CAMNT_0053959019 /DNA_START=65 /DNA_END=634 /DNA_ORIENTATION=+
MLRSFTRLAKISYQGHTPKISPKAWVAKSADIIGQVEIGDDSSVWYNCVIRGDADKIVIGKRTNIQDGTVIHCRGGDLGGGVPQSTIIGDDVTVGHQALLHACILEDRSFVGMQACVMDFARVESGGMVAAGAMVTGKTVVKSGELWGGRPAKKMRDLSKEEIEFLKLSADVYAENGRKHKSGCKEVEE